MAIPLTFYLASSQTQGPASGTPSVLLWHPGAAVWFTPNGALSSAGHGTWTVAADATDQPGQWPILLYATAADSFPSAYVLAPPGTLHTVGDTSIPMAFWLGTAADPATPAIGLSPAVQVSLGGTGYQSAAGSVAEPGAAGYGGGPYGSGPYGGGGCGFYLYWPTAADVQSAGTVALYVTAAGAEPDQWEYPVADGASTALKAPAVTWATPAPIDAATALSGAQLDATASVPGTFAYSPDVGIILPAGAYTLSALFTPTDTGTYSSAVVHVPLTVTVAPTPTPTPPPPGLRERDIWNAAQAALDATGAFDGVYLWGFPDASEQSSEDTRAVAIIPRDFAEEDRWDGVADGTALITSHVRLEVMVRDQDAQRRDEEADRLRNVCFDSLNGQSMAGMTYPYLTRVRKGVWRDPSPPQKTIELIYEYTFDAPSMAAFSTSE